MSYGSWRSPGQVISPEVANPSKGAAGKPGRQPEATSGIGMCVSPGTDMGVQDGNADGSEDKFPWQGLWQGAGLGWSAVTQRTRSCCVWE